jgi:drug/metabolite transporter (DMT)-like permease
MSHRSAEITPLRRDQNEHPLSNPPKPISQRRKIIKLIFGVLCTMGIVVGWVGGAFITQIIEKKSFDKPMFIFYFNTNFFVLCGIVQIAIDVYKYTKHGRRLPVYYKWAMKSDSYEKLGISGEETENQNSTKDLTLLRLFLSCLVLTVLWVSSGYMWFVGLSMTSVSNSSAIYQCASFFVFIFSFLCLNEKANLSKTMAVLVSMAGVFLISYVGASGTKSEEFPHELEGNFYMLGSAFTWGLYEVFYKKFIGDAKLDLVNMYMMVMGLINVFLLWPILVVLHCTEIEPFEFPSLDTLMWLLFNAGVGLSLNYLIMLSIALTSPLFTRIGEMCTIPGSMLVDLVILKQVLPISWYFGAIMVIGGFVLLNVAYVYETKHEKKGLGASLWEKIWCKSCQINWKKRRRQ